MTVAREPPRAAPYPSAGSNQHEVQPQKKLTPPSAKRRLDSRATNSIGLSIPVNTAFALTALLMRQRNFENSSPSRNLRQVGSLHSGLGIAAGGAFADGKTVHSPVSIDCMAGTMEPAEPRLQRTVDTAAGATRSCGVARQNSDLPSNQADVCQCLSRLSFGLKGQPNGPNERAAAAETTTINRFQNRTAYKSFRIRCRPSGS